MTVRAKFRVSRIERSLGSVYTPATEGQKEKWGTGEVQTIVLVPVTGNSGENARFFASTPSGEIRLGTVNAEAAAEFDLEKEYYVEFTKAE